MSTWQELTNEQLEALPTNRLYTVYKLYRSLAYYLWYRHDTCGSNNNYKEIGDKQDFIKNILDTRGHIEREEEKPQTGKPSKQAMEREEKKWSSYYFLDQPARAELVGSIKNAASAIGKQVYKKSKKPFKSKRAYNTVTDVTTNIHTNREAFTFEEDTSVVDVHLCHIREERKNEYR